MDFIYTVVFFAIVWFVWKWYRKRGGQATTSGWVQSSPKQVRKTSPQKKKKARNGVLQFEAERKEPEADDQGRVVVRLAGGKPVEFDVFLMTTDLSQRYLLGKPNEDFLERRTRVRVARTQQRGQEVFQVTTPGNDLIGEIRYDDFKEAVSIFSEVEKGLFGASKQLKGRALVFDVSALVEGSWDFDTESQTWEGNVDLVLIQIKNPAGIDVR
jgi:hypothetical protein